MPLATLFEVYKDVDEPPAATFRQCNSAQSRARNPTTP
ncbi:hypothetical protein HNR46_003670 [Haloferula luteola]|uniref:Uncharacterized protein n=1 Tax=Haloferula luteola TaxID=595692 RepID=A0A840V6V9_9BACT|nr:hypothetical protein [Haloferula luteola]